MSARKFAVTGMTCSACSAAVERAVAAVAGVESVTVNLLTNSMTVDFDDTTAENSSDISVVDETIITAVKNAGYGAVVFTSGKHSARAIADAEYQKMKRRLIRSVIFTLPLFYISMGHMMGLPIPNALHHGDRGALLFALTQLILCVPVIAINFEFFTDGAKTMLNRSPNMNALISIGSGAAVIYGLFITGEMALDYANGGEFVNRSMDLYFESAAMILTLITVGKTLEMRARRRTSDAISKLVDLSPKVASVERDGEEISIPAEDIRAGDVVIIRAGGTVPVDGVILFGSCSVDESAITGESVPVDKTEGDHLVSPGILKSGFVKMRAEKIGADTTLSQIIRLVEEAASSKAPISRLADKVSGIFVPIVISAAAVTLAVWLIAGAGITFALRCAISVLVISCPCALGLATPTAIMSGVGRGASLGILIKSAEALETSHKIDTVVLDKTGTVTEGKMHVTDVICSSRADISSAAKTFSEDELLRIAASIESASSHPIAEAVTAHARERDITLLETADFREVAGGGIIGEISLGGKNMQIAGGNVRLMKSLDIVLGADVESNVTSLAATGKTPLIFADIERKTTVGVIALADRIKASSVEAIKILQSAADVIMLTGDNAVTAASIAAQVGIAPKNVISGVLPDGKEAEIARLMSEGRVVSMIGDGINDAPALVRADVGIAVGAGTDIAIDSADIVLVRGDLRDAAAAIALSRAVMRNIKQNLAWAFVYNMAGIPIAAGVLYPMFKIGLDPMYAAAAMSLSSFCVVMNALRLKRFKPDLSNMKANKKSKNKTKSKEEIEMFGKKKNTVVLTVGGMSCAHCSARVEKALSAIDGVSVKVDLKKGTATVSSDNAVDAQALCDAVVKAGYTASVKEA